MEARYTLTHSHAVPMTVLFPTFSSPFSARSLALVGSGHITLRHLACRLVSTRFHQSAKSGSDASARHVRTKKAEPQSSLAAAPLRPQHSLGVPALWQGSFAVPTPLPHCQPACQPIWRPWPTMTTPSATLTPIPALVPIWSTHNRNCCGFVFSISLALSMALHSCSCLVPISILLRFVLKTFQNAFWGFHIAVFTVNCPFSTGVFECLGIFEAPNGKFIRIACSRRHVLHIAKLIVVKNQTDTWMTIASDLIIRIYCIRNCIKTWLCNAEKRKLVFKFNSAAGNTVS